MIAVKINKELNYDIVVIGGGPSGITAAKGAIKNHNKVLLIERSGYLGGCITQSLVVPMMTFHAGDKQIIEGYAQDIIDRLKEAKGSIGHILDPLGVGKTVTPIDTEIFKYEVQEYLLEHGVDIVYHCEFLEVEISENKINSIIINSKSGMHKIKGKYFIDATGEGLVAYKSGCSMKIGREKDGKCQPMSMMFKVGGVDREKIIEYADENRNDFVIEEGIKSLKDVERIAISGFFSKIKEGIDKGEFNVNRDRVLAFELNTKGEMIINMTRVINKISVNNFDLSEATIEARRQVFAVFKFLKKYIVGFENSYLIQSGNEIGVRESRRLEGIYTINEREIVSGYKPEDTIALGSWPIDIHDPEGRNLVIQSMRMGDYYGIPYGCMIPKEIDNLIVTGKAISATHEALASLRVSPICMALGQAAGTAAYIANEYGSSFKDVNYERLREALKEDNQILE